MVPVVFSPTRRRPRVLVVWNDLQRVYSGGFRLILEIRWSEHKQPRHFPSIPSAWSLEQLLLNGKRLGIRLSQSAFPHNKIPTKRVTEFESNSVYVVSQVIPVLRTSAEMSTGM